LSFEWSAVKKNIPVDQPKSPPNDKAASCSQLMMKDTAWYACYKPQNTSAHIRFVDDGLQNQRKNNI
jgi:hypothetical protein